MWLTAPAGQVSLVVRQRQEEQDTLATRWPAIVGLLTAFTSSVGCSILIQGNPVPPPPQGVREICVVENPPVRAEFLTALTTSLERKDLRVRVLDPGTPPSACPIAATYLGKWSWDFVPYMATGDITVFHNGSRVADATYRAPRGGWALTFGIYRSTETKVGLMVDQLFPIHP